MAGRVIAGQALQPLVGSVSVNGLIVKYSPSGQVLWSRQIDDAIIALLLDGQQQLLVLTAQASSKYTTAGNLLWRTPHLQAGPWSPAAAASAPEGGIYLAGSIGDSFTGHLDLGVARLDGLGRLVWLRTWNGPASLDDEAQNIGVDTTGTIYVAGRSRKQESPAIDAHVTAAFDAGGALLWAHLVAAPDYTVPAAFAADPAGGAVLSVPLGQGFSDWRTLRNTTRPGRFRGLGTSATSSTRKTGFRTSPP